MSLYSTGTVNMTNASAAVVGVGTAFVANVDAGDGFLITGETVYYTVLSITDDTHLTLSVVYAGATGTGKTYQVSRDWTTNLGLAEIQPGDPNWPYLLTQKALRKIDTDVAPKASPVFTTQITTPKIVTASGGLEITPGGAGNVGVGITPATRNNTRLQIVDGIGFPATQVASSDPNTLDDYEEGTWTPDINGTTPGTTTYTTNVGKYTKIGRLVTVNAMSIWTSATGSGDFRINNLPFAAASDSIRTPVTLYFDSVTVAAGGTVVGRINEGVNIVVPQQIASGGGVEVVISFDTAGSMFLSATYMV